MTVFLSAFLNTTGKVYAPRGIHAMENPAGAWTYAVQDGLGSVRIEVGALNIVSAAQTYAPFGSPFSTHGTFAGGFGFTGEQVDSSGQVYLRARYYTPSLGVFPSLDPFEGMSDRPMSLNGYAWVEGNTPNWTDPSGLTCYDPFEGGGGGMICLETGSYGRGSTSSGVGTSASRWPLAPAITTRNIRPLVWAGAAAAAAAVALQVAPDIEIDLGPGQQSVVPGVASTAVAPTLVPQRPPEPPQQTPQGPQGPNRFGLQFAILAGVLTGYLVWRLIENGLCPDAAPQATPAPRLTPQPTPSATPTPIPDVNLDTGSLTGLVAHNPRNPSQTDMIRTEIQTLIGGKNMVVTATALQEFNTGLSNRAGPTEQARAQVLLASVRHIPDTPSPTFDQRVGITGNFGRNDQIIFGTGYSLGIETATGNRRAVNYIRQTIPNFLALVHTPARFRENFV